MNNKVIVWQIIVVILSVFLIFVIKNYLENKIVLEAMKIAADTKRDRANCFAISAEKNLNDAYCQDIDTSAYKFFEKAKQPEKF